MPTNACHALLAAALVSSLSSAALAAPVEGSTRIAVQAGWRYAPNGRFAELAAANGHPLSGASAGGPSIIGVFGYRLREDAELALEIGGAQEHFGLKDGGGLDLLQVPLGAVARWAPFSSGGFLPYVGAGAAYFLNFFSGGPAGPGEHHTYGPLAVLGASWALSDSLGLVAEYRFGLARVIAPGLGSLQVGANTLQIGIEFLSPPEPRTFP